MKGVKGVKDSDSLAALAFKVANDPFVGTLTYVRVYTGKIASGDRVWNPRLQKKERIQRLVKMHAGNRQEVQILEAGDIGAILGLKLTVTGDTLCSEQKPIVLGKYCLSSTSDFYGH